MNIKEELEFCKEQIKFYTSLYNRLVSVGLKTPDVVAPEAPAVDIPVNIPVDTSEDDIKDDEDLTEKIKNLVATEAGFDDEEEDFIRINERKVNARAGLEEHENKLAQIYAEERRLLSQGLDRETVRLRVREKLYPGGIPGDASKKDDDEELSLKLKRINTKRAPPPQMETPLIEGEEIDDPADIVEERIVS
jgi:hypothetical protein